MAIGVVFRKHDKKRLLIFFIVFSFIGFNYIKYYEKAFDTLPSNSDISGKFKVISLKDEKKYKDCYLIKGSAGIKYKLYVSKNEPEVEYGSYLYIIGKLKKEESPTNEFQFDYQKYLKQNKVFGSIMPKKISIVSSKLSILDKSICKILKLRKNVIKLIESNYDKKQSGFIKAILFSDKSSLDDELKNSIEKNNLAFIMAVSGMHVSYVILIIRSILKINRKTQNVLISIFLIAFLFLVDFTSSSMRAVGMLIVSMILFNLSRETSFLNNLSIVVFVLLLFNPYNIVNISLIFSAGGILGIYLFKKPLEKLLLKKHKYLALGISVQLLIFPIVWYNFYTISGISIIINSLLIWLVSLIILVGYCSLIELIIRLNIISTINRSLIKYFFSVLNILNDIPYMIFYYKRPNIIFVVTYYIVIIFIIKKVKQSPVKSFIHIYRLKCEKKIWKIMCILIIIIVCISNFNIQTNEMEIFFLDVGQGDCTVIKYNSKFIVIDGGEGAESNFDYGENVLFSFLINKGAKKIDLLIISHFDSDHVGGLLTIMEKLKVDKAIISKQVESTENYRKFIDIANKKRINIIQAGMGDRLNITNSLYFDVLWPNNSKLVRENSINNNSIVCKLNYNSFSMLFTGDIEEVAEKQILQEYKENVEMLKSTVLKVAHHGSKTSSTVNFIEAIKPKVALIGVGENNKFGHPSNQVIERLKKYNARIYRTDENGEISITINKNGEIIKVKKYIVDIFKL